MTAREELEKVAADVKDQASYSKMYQVAALHYMAGTATWDEIRQIISPTVIANLDKPPAERFQVPDEAHVMYEASRVTLRARWGYAPDDIIEHPVLGRGRVCAIVGDCGDHGRPAGVSFRTKFDSDNVGDPVPSKVRDVSKDDIANGTVPDLYTMRADSDGNYLHERD